MTESVLENELFNESVAPRDLSANSKSARQNIYDVRFISSLGALVFLLLGIITVSWNWTVGSYFFIGSGALLVMAFFIIDHVVYHIDEKDLSKANRNLVLWMFPGFVFGLFPGISLWRVYSNLDVAHSPTIDEELSYPPDYYRELYSRTKTHVE